ncbi:MAG: hypothetical protein ACO20H_10690 [Bacteriovoracaceae bacterium]
MNKKESSFDKMQLVYAEGLSRSIDVIEELLIKIEKEQNPAGFIVEFRREIYSLKGSTSIFNLNFITNSINELEDFLSLEETVYNSEDLKKVKEVLQYLREYSKAFKTINSEDKENLYNTILNTLYAEKKQRRVLINGDFPLLNKKIQKAFKELNAHISFCQNGYEALGRLLNEKFDLLITSYKSEQIKGTTLAKMIKVNEDINREMKMVLLTSMENIEDLDEFDAVLKKDSNTETKLREEYLKFFKI